MRPERQARQFRDFLRGAFREFRMSIQTGAYGSAADREIVQAGKDFLEPVNIAIQQANPT
jgi:hypothetical protein